MKIIRLILGDQLNYQHSWFATVNPNVVYTLMEVRQETEYVKHHIQKLVGFFASMRQFAQWLQAEGHQVMYLTLDNPQNLQSFQENIEAILKENPTLELFEYLLPDEYRLDIALKEISRRLSVPTKVYDTEHFLTSRDELQDFFRGKKTYLMESFYRQMRRKHQILMEGNEPLTGKWNYDAENRKKYTYQIPLPQHPTFQHSVRELYEMIQKMKISAFGEINIENFEWCINRTEALQLLDFFVENCLFAFGTYQDAMEKNAPYLFHSRLSFALNLKMLHPLEVVQKVIDYWEENSLHISIAQVEGFVRQIIGWREYMRGIYWATMPEFAEKNYFNHQHKLPDFYWTAQTKMNCLHHTIRQALDKAYNHHIQRLMITGNFALLAGIHPDEVDAWYLGVYIDAIEWVEITNTRGMSQFADGGLVGTKPYISSANYVDKMSSYCKGCYYDKNKKYGDKACPFNSLYWYFYHQHRHLLAQNPRIGMAYVMLDKMPEVEKEKIFLQAKHYLAQMNEL